MTATTRSETVLGAGRAHGGLPEPPAAARARRPRWRDPRLLLGLALVAASALLGARVLGADDGTAAVWATRTAMSAGQVLSTDDVVARPVRFVGREDADRYLGATRALPTGARLTRDVGAGELLPRAAVGQGGAAMIEVPLSVPADAVPAGVAVGSVVDVWVTPPAEGSAATGSTGAAGGRSGVAEATLVFDDVPVLTAPEVGSSLGPVATRQVMVGVDTGTQRPLAAALASLGGGDVLLTGRR